MITKISIGDNTFQLSKFGGQIISWEKSGVPIIFENKEKNSYDGSTPYRGGAPVIFPYFAKGKFLPNKTTIEPQHGPARRCIWDQKVSIETAQKKSIILTTEHPSPEGYTETTLRLELEYIFDENLEIISRITNLGDSPTPFQYALHTYWETSDPLKTKIQGLGTKYLDNLKDLSLVETEVEDSSIITPIDRVYFEPKSNIEVTTPEYKLDIINKDLNTIVVWNPGPNHGMKDLGSANFLCVESGIIYPSKTIKAKETITQTIKYIVQLR